MIKELSRKRLNFEPVITAGHKIAKNRYFVWPIKKYLYKERVKINKLYFDILHNN